jgi:BirA family biotin operon repressor/biotin-[acetyl-CoA-carboxylase] ligase
MQEKILDSLRKKYDYVSGDQISQRLGVSRQALWKHIQELRDAGYDIIAVPHLGYRLESAPDRLFEFEVLRGLKTQILGRRIVYFDSITSTMDTALQLGLKGASDGTLIIAESQTKGRGRLGRNWFSPKYKGIYISLILRPEALPGSVSILTLLAGVSIVEAVKEFTGISCEIKWPNDIIIRHKKLGGILTELNAEMDKVNFVVIGMGLNVNNDKSGLISGATSLKEQKKDEVSRVGLLQEILRCTEINYLNWQHKGAKPILDKWREYSMTLGKRVKVYCQSEHIEGEAAGIDADGGLLIRKDSGVVKKVMAGDVVHCR